MKVLRGVDAVRQWREGVAPKRRVALVPTMGFLHAGHLSLFELARERVGEGGQVVASIFVNPTQFGAGEDLSVYPRDEAGDLAKCKEAGVDVVFMPERVEEVFAEDAATWVSVSKLEDVLCGRHRPRHFRGVCTVCTKLWNLILPDVSVYGQKDFQQLTILRRMHRELFLSGEIVGAPLVRESDGLAMSSRNVNLSTEARAQALAIPRWLDQVRARFESGERRGAALLAAVEEALAPGRIDYAEIRDAEDLSSVDVIEGVAVCAVAVHFGGVRLIDNVLLDPRG